MTTKANLAALHSKSSRHRALLSHAKICGCFYCFHEFPFEEITEWIDDNETARCPYCSVDAVLGFDTSTADQELLHQMHERWFGNPKRLTPDAWKDAIEQNVWPATPVKPSTRK